MKEIIEFVAEHFWLIVFAVGFSAIWAAKVTGLLNLCLGLPPEEN